MLDVQIRKRLATGRKRGDSFSLDVSLSCATRRLVLFGHSGSGKTLTLQSLAGLVRPDGGYIKIGDDVLYASEQGIDLPARERHLGYVFQDYALFPHLTVRRNVEFALDKLEIVEKDGTIQIMPVAVYPKKYLDELRSEINETKAKIAAGEQPVFDTVDELFEMLDGVS